METGKQGDVKEWLTLGDTKTLDWETNFSLKKWHLSQVFQVPQTASEMAQRLNKLGMIRRKADRVEQKG